jgi:hypothetical protein
LKYILIYIKKVLVKEMKKTKPMNFWHMNIYYIYDIYCYK